MSRRALVTVGLFSVLVAASVLTFSLPGAAQDGSWTPPRTPYGAPDIQGVFTTSVITPLERPERLGTQEFYTPEEVAEMEARRRQPAEVQTEDDRDRGSTRDVHYQLAQFGLDAGSNEFSSNLRTSIIVDPPNGRMPEEVPAARERAAARRAANTGGAYDGPENRPLTERCIVWTSTLPPILPGGYNSNMQIFQSPGFVVIQAEMGDPRVIPTDGRGHVSDRIPQWNGNSVGHWEGDTLVVETTGFREETAWRGSSTHLKVTERLRRVSDDVVEYGFTIEDPETWTEPWSGVYPLQEIEGPLFEYACHEGNYGMANILSGQRAQEAAARAAEGQ